ncbi:phage tail family protein [Bacillus luti]|uniref:phage tail family protein n=1 Tax=Bacillus luti TaxID=2026191 RepID=UPI00289EE848|nr:phage tail family protein [Bacillus luti]
MNLKELNNFKIIYKNGKVFDMKKYNLYVTRWHLPTSNINHEFENAADGSDGLLDLGSTYGAWEGSAECRIEAKDNADFELLRDELKRILFSREAFYIVRDQMPGFRRLVKCKNPLAFARSERHGKITIDFISSASYWESVGTTMSPFTFDSNLWQLGQNLPAEDLIYKPTTTSFQIYNASDVEIDPRKLPLIIRIRGATNGLTITNRTTGDVFKLNIPTAAGDTVELNRVRVFKNGNTVFTSTNRKVIKLAPGWNDFIVSGTSGAFQIEFDFRFYYL